MLGRNKIQSDRTGQVGLYLVFILVFSLFFLFSCADQKRRTVKEQFSSGVFSVSQAKDLYGDPDVVMKQADGLTRYSWIYHEEWKTPDRVYYYRDGLFREERIVKGKFFRNYCFFSLYTNDDGAVQDSSWEGNSCERMTEVHRNKGKVNGLPDKNIEVDIP